MEKMLPTKTYSSLINRCWLPKTREDSDLDHDEIDKQNSTEDRLAHIATPPSKVGVSNMSAKI